MAAEEFEFAIIGGGKGGKTLAVDRASAGKKVVLIERKMIGGSCINVACIPTKTLVRSAKAAEFAEKAATFGVKADFHGVDWIAVRNRKRAVVDGLVRINQEKFDHSGMTFLLGEARFTGPKTMEVELAAGGRRVVTAEKIYINTGARPSLPPIPGADKVDPLTSESIMELDRLPEHLIILGGGYIGLEFAQMFRRFGSKVSLIERGARFLPREDADVAAAVLDILRQDGIDILQSTKIVGVEGRSGEEVSVRIESAGRPPILTGSHVLIAAGRVPNTETLNLTAAGVALDARGFVQVNDRLETSAPGVWAVGDVHGGPQFTHASLDDFRILKANLEGGNRTTSDRLMPYTLFIDPELGRVGLTEDDARSRGLAVRVAKIPLAAVPRARTMGETRGLFKAIVDASTNQILGASILAPEGGEVMAVVQTAMLAKLPYTFLRDNIFAHPTMAEGLNDLFTRLE